MLSKMGLAALVLPLFDDELFLTIMRTCLNNVEAAMLSPTVRSVNKRSGGTWDRLSACPEGQGPFRQANSLSYTELGCLAYS